MFSRSRLTVVALASLVIGAAGALAVSFANPFAPRVRTAALAEHDADGSIRETFSFHAPDDGIAATHDGHPSKPVKTFPAGIGLLNDPNLRSGFVLLAKARNRDGEVVGFASEMEEVAPQSNIMQGRMQMLSTWTLELPGRGTIFMYETEDASEFAKKVVVPALTLGKTWDQPWTFTTTTGPRPDGRGVIVGGTGEFDGITGSFVEVTHLKRFTPDGQLALTMELQLAYRKTGTASAAAVVEP
jgi:hypothetical protein